jgi:multiple sugar transport system substrate-binding protein
MRTTSKTSRRDFLKLAASATALGPFFLFPDRVLAGQKTLTIAKWAHFLPEFDHWFVNVLAKEWGQKHETKVTVNIIPIEEVHARASAEVKQDKGHDVFMFPWPPAEFYRNVIDHGEVYQTVAQKYGQIDQFAYRSTFHPKLKQYFAFADYWVPAPFLYFQDYWKEINAPFGPMHWDGLRSAGKTLREKLEVPCGLALSPTLDGNVTLHSLLLAFNSFVLDRVGNIALNNARTTEALDYIKYLYRDSGTPEQLAWGQGGNVKAMLARKTSCTINSISLLRIAEKQDREVAKKIMLQPPLSGSGSEVGMPQAMNCSVIWRFATNQEGAKQFLADLIDSSQAGYEQSKGCNFAFYQKTIPDLVVRLSQDQNADPAWKYVALKDALHWTRNPGVPGFATPAFMELFNTFVIPRMFISVAKGERNSIDAINAATAEVQKIVDKWKQIG